MSDTPQQVFLLVGQSNMAGRAVMEPGDERPIDRVMLSDNFGQWEPATQPLNRYANIRRRLTMQRLSLGQFFAERYIEHTGVESIGLIVNAQGGSDIDWWKPADEPGAVNGSLYDSTLIRWIDAGQPRLTGILWHQGENNFEDPNYYDKAMELFAAFRRDFEQPELPIVLAHIRGGTIINPQIDRVAQTLDHVAVVKVEGLNVFDDWHYDRPSTLELGKRYADAFLSIE